MHPRYIEVSESSPIWLRNVCVQLVAAAELLRDVLAQLPKFSMSNFLYSRDLQVLSLEQNEDDRCPESLEVNGAPLDHALVAKVLDCPFDVLMPYLP